MSLQKSAVRVVASLALFSTAACIKEVPPPGTKESAEIAPFGAGTVTGNVFFSKRKDGVSVTVRLEDCPDGSHPVHVHQGTSCTDAASQGVHWGPGGVRGEGIPNVECVDGEGSVTWLNDRTDANLLWTLDGDPETDPVGHAFVVHAPGGERIGCGVIEEL